MVEEFVAQSAADKQPSKVHRDAMDAIDAFLRRFGRAVSVNIEPLDVDGYTDVRHGNTVVGINVVAEHDTLILLVRMGEVDAEADASELRRLLELNFLHTGDCAFAIDAATSRLYLKATRALSGLDYHEFAELLQSVVQIAENIAAHLEWPRDTR